MVLYDVPKEEILSTFLESERVLGERSSPENGGREVQSSAVHSAKRGSAAPNSKYWIREQLHTELSCSCKNAQKTGSLTVVAVQLVTKAWSALSKSVGLENFQGVCWLYLINDSKKTLLQALM